MGQAAGWLDAPVGPCPFVTDARPRMPRETELAGNGARASSPTCRSARLSGPFDTLRDGGKSTSGGGRRTRAGRPMTAVGLGRRSARAGCEIQHRKRGPAASPGGSHQCLDEE